MASHGVTRVSDGPPRSQQEREKEVAKIKQYKDLVSSVTLKIQECDLSHETLKLTSKLLIQNPEYYTIWNHRRRIILSLLSTEGSADINGGDRSEIETHALAKDLISSDLEFLLPLLRKYPKCYWIWNYRLWLLEQCTQRLEKAQARQFWQQELGLVGKMLTLDSRNFHGWGYRRTVIAALESPRLRVDDVPETLTQQEFDYTTKMINTNLSNFSAWHNRSKLIPRLLDERQASAQVRKKMLDDELDLIQRALWAGDNDSSLWFYHQYLISNLDHDHTSHSIAPHLSHDERTTYLLAEFDKVLEMLDGAEDCKWIYQALLHVAFLHSKHAGSLPPAARDWQIWIDTLIKIDPLRADRWADVSDTLKKR